MAGELIIYEVTEETQKVGVYLKQSNWTSWVKLKQKGINGDTSTHRNLLFRVLHRKCRKLPTEVAWPNRQSSLIQLCAPAAGWRAVVFSFT